MQAGLFEATSVPEMVAPSRHDEPSHHQEPSHHDEPSQHEGPGQHEGHAKPPLDERRVSDWLAANLPAATPPFRFTLVAGGHSNLTYRVDDANGRSFALRRPPRGSLLPTAHDMAREHRVVSALWPTAVPVPQVFALCEDTEVSGASFYVMDFVDGLVVRDEETCRSGLSEAARRQASWSIADTLAATHALDVDEVGLGDLARRDGYIERQLRRWMDQFTHSRVAGDEGSGTTALVEAVHAKLAARVPPQAGLALVHGDYRLDNTVLGEDGSVLAVLDWEICTLGDPLADLGLLMVYWAEAGEEASLLGVSPTALPGFATRAELCARYEASTKRDLSLLGFYVAFGYWKLACILQGVYARYAAGAQAGDPSGVEGFARQVARLAEMAMTALDEL